jgi:transcriptional regulator with XRE-family HTH domain
MTIESWPDYVRRLAGSLNQTQVAEKTGMAQSNVGRWLRGERAVPRAESVIAFAKAFGQSPVEALVAAGYLDAEEVDLPAARPLAHYSERDLLDELRSRHAD